MAKKLSELYAPKPAAEKAFVAKHGEPKKTTDKSPATKDDKRFKATNIKTYDRSPRHGYNPGEDEKAYGTGGKNPGPNDQNPAPKNGSAQYPTGTFEEVELDERDANNKAKKDDAMMAQGKDYYDKKKLGGLSKKKGIATTQLKRLARGLARYPQNYKEDVDTEINEFDLSEEDIDTLLNILDIVLEVKAPAEPEKETPAVAGAAKKATKLLKKKVK
jgi:hypothetical protein